MVAVGFLGVGGALGPAHGQGGDPECGNVGKIVDRVVQEGYAASEQATANFGDDQAEGSGDGPAEDSGAQLRMCVAFVAVRVGVSRVAVRMTYGRLSRRLAVRVAVVRAVTVLPHGIYVTRMSVWMQPHGVIVDGLVGQFDTEAPRRDWRSWPRLPTCDKLCGGHFG